MKKSAKFLFGISIVLNLGLVIVLIFLVVRFKSDILAKSSAKRPYSIVIFGDSLIANANWNVTLERNDIYNAGVPGFTTSHFVWLLDEKVIRHTPKVCLLEGGINDISVGIPLARTFANFESIVDTLLHYKIEPVLQSTLFINRDTDSSINLKVDTLNSYLRRLSKSRGIEYIDINSVVSDNGKLKKNLTYDGTHLNGQGYKLWSLKVADILKKKQL